MSSEKESENLSRRKPKVSQGRLVHLSLAGPKPRAKAVGDGQQVDIPAKYPAEKNERSKSVYQSAGPDMVSRAGGEPDEQGPADERHGGADRPQRRLAGRRGFLLDRAAAQAHGVGLDAIEERRGQGWTRLQPGSLKVLGHGCRDGPQFGPNIDKRNLD